MQTRLRAAEAPRTAQQRFGRIAARIRIPQLRAWVVIVVLLGSFIGLAAGSPRQNPSSWDARLTRYIEGFPDGDHVVSDLFDLALHPAAQLLGGLAVLAAALTQVRTRRRRAVLFAVFTFVGALVLEPVLKDVIQRPPFRGPMTAYSFPSGHALRSMAGVVALILLLWHSRFRGLIAVSGGLAVAIVGVAIIHQDGHWASDVLGGWCLGAAWVTLLYVTIQPVRSATDEKARVRAGR